MTAVALDESLSSVLSEELASWDVEQGACALVDTAGVVAVAGDAQALHRWASVTKVVAALAVLDVAHDGLLDLDAPAGPDGASMRHLLGHASGLAFDEQRVLAEPGRRRVYSNVGIDLAVDIAVGATGVASPAVLLADRVLRPLRMHSTVLAGPAAYGAIGPLEDLSLLASELLQPSILRPAVIDAAITPSFPGLAGVLPGFGRQDPNDWGLGVEIRGVKSPHWMPAQAAPDAFGHFGQAGSFCWVDRSLGLAAVALTSTDFGPWAAEAWPRSSARWIDEYRGEGRRP